MEKIRILLLICLSLGFLYPVNADTIADSGIPVFKKAPEIKSTAWQFFHRKYFVFFSGAPVSLKEPWTSAQRLTMSNYIKNLVNNIETLSNPAIMPKDSCASVIIGIDIDRSGKLSNIVLLHSSGKTDADNMAMNAISSINKKGLYEPLPDFSYVSAKPVRAAIEFHEGKTCTDKKREAIFDKVDKFKRSKK